MDEDALIARYAGVDAAWHSVESVPSEVMRNQYNDLLEEGRCFARQKQVLSLDI